MILSFQTLFISMLTSAPFILLLHILMKKINDKSLVPAKILNILSLLIILRMLLPFEYPYTISLYSTVVFPFLRDLFLAELPLIRTSLLVLLCIVWATGSLYKLLKLMREYRALQHLLAHSVVADELIEAFPTKYQRYQVKVTPYIKSPCVIGVFRPTIILPNTFFTTKELQYILQHEYLHISRLDLFLKAIYELLIVVYWWNPLMYIFRQQFSSIIELGVDEELVENLSTDERIEYIELMLKVQNEQNYLSQESEFALYFSSTTSEPLYQRSASILNKRKFKLNKASVITLFLIGFYLSTSIVIEPFYENRPGTEGTLLINEENAYFIINSNNEFDLYIEGQFLQTFPSITDETFLNLPQYNSKEEINDKK